MSKRSPVGIFLAASALMAASTVTVQNIGYAGERDLGGLKEWTTDQEIDAESTLDEAAEKAKKEAEKDDICIPVGEGENCW
ncbi:MULTISPECIES: hypothetical protein [Prochlorococcus]|uniref:Peptidase family M20/M25/M40 n=1 Tax=Prochlorococcus marinus (strain SARG / CCMP1375 / SS120) TaxID=167539 RepID=Q7VB30_PROMA|nr:MULTISPECIES: hypothetical protein [Prochlorococcus]AAQ00314.1 Predicted protein [Prochlorococcus marinus subsp. marinus str. CCMP1375]KGG22237.1 putative Peptidase family M20/M25/M40 [Prochlorococcus marinus str. SS2]KGG24446.1 putative Peptidase family M20/M25/M40 [Prochlorococcus marinus str. SS35]KGG35482.1 putative Peptidase family M20/M25/M40 [Prochlorococcus sp. SS52]